MAEETPNFEQIAKDLQEANEKLHIRIAKSFGKSAVVPTFLATLQAKWESLSYLEKVYTISMVVIAGSILIGQVVASLQKAPQGTIQKPIYFDRNNLEPAIEELKRRLQGLGNV